MATFNNKFGVPLSGTGAGFENSDVLQPKLKYKFRVLVQDFGAGAGLNDLSQNVVTVGRPNINYGESPIHSFNSVAYIIGKHEWQTLELVVRDEVNNNIASLVGNQIQKQTDHINQTSPLAGNEYKFKMQVSWLDGVGTPQETWSMLGCFLQSVNYDSGDYAANDPVQISMTIRYDNAFHGTGVFEGAPDSIAAADITSAVADQVSE